jgi:hypothetical protein
MYNDLVEYTVGNIHRKQKTITSLFPQFPSRVRGVADKGGVRLHDIDSNLWHFRVHSGTEDTLWYDCYIYFKNMEEIIRRTVMNRKMWTKDGRKIDLRKLASEMMNRSDLQISCNCPAFLYWGSDYILSRPKRDAKYGPPEHRRPKIRNPREYGSMCKHLDAMMKTYPFYRSTMAKYLHEFWGNIIAQIEEEAKKEREGFKKASAELKRKKEEEEAAPPTAEEPTAEEEASPEEETTKESLNIKEAKGLFLRTSKDQTGPVFGMNPNSILLRAFDNEDLAVEYARRNELAGWITTYVSSVEYKKATRQDFVKSQKLFKLEQEIRRLEQEFEEEEEE